MGRGKKRSIGLKIKKKQELLMLITVQRLRCEFLESEMETADMTGRHKTLKQAPLSIDATQGKRKVSC